MAAPARALVAAGVLHLVFGATPAASQSQNGTASVRARAEELAEEATRRFDEVLNREPPARAEHRSAILEGHWKEVLSWIERSNRDFDGLLRRLAAEVGPRARAASGSDWLSQSRERFETIMRRLTEGAAPPAEDRSLAAPGKPPDATPSGPPEAVAREIAREPVAGGMGSERPLAERRRAEPAPAAGTPRKTPSPAPGREAEETLPDRQPKAAIAAPAGAPPAQAVPRAGRAAAPAPGVRAEGKTAERAHGETFAKRRSRQATRAGSPAAASAAKAAASASHIASHIASHRAARRGVRHRHGRGLRACAAAGDIAPPGWYVVKKGDTLWGISRNHYGAGRHYRRIAAANWRRLHGTNRIHPCERLFLPGAARR
jgi:nucleoid-associated protein YgaU